MDRVMRARHVFKKRRLVDPCLSASGYEFVRSIG
jgi:hypothetical protein